MLLVQILLPPDMSIMKEWNHVWNVVLSSLKAYTTGGYQLPREQYAFA